MKATDYVIKETEKAMKAVIERARKVPEDKQNWSPLDNGRAVISLAQECTHSILWPVELIQTRKFEMTDEAMAQFKADCENWSDLDKCEAAMGERFEKFKSCISALSDEELDQKIEVPWGDMSVLDAAGIAAWNCTYHVGQINYIQTLYGDKEM